MTDPEFRQAMSRLPEPPNDSHPPFWDYWRHDLWERAQTESPDHFVEWPCIRHTMLVDHFDMTEPRTYLSGENRWLDAVHADQNSIHLALVEQAHHLKRWEDVTGQRIENLKRIYEFGGGFGALALLTHRLGFKGEYTVYDLPEFALLQRWYLAQYGIAVRHAEAGKIVDADLFVAAYSISETPIEFRDAFMANLKAGSYLFLYSSQFAEYDNAAWFARVMADRPLVNWSVNAFPGRPDWYLIGC